MMVFISALVLMLGATAQAQELMTLEALKAKAFDLCQTPYQKPVPEAIAALDPPKSGGKNAEGLVYQEELAITATNLLDQQGFYFQPRPRAALNRLGMDIFVGLNGPGSYGPKTWYDAKPDYSSPMITPPIDPLQLPESAKVLTEVIVGHKSPQGDYPQMINFRSSAYLRFAGYPPQSMGASLRLGAHNVFSLDDVPETGRHEDFPIIRQLYMSLTSDKAGHAFVLAENGLKCGALEINFEVGEKTSLDVNGHWYLRRDFFWQKDRHTGLVAYSSMFWKNEMQTPENEGDEAHDSDVLRVIHADGREIKHQISVPEKGLNTHNFSNVKEWSLAQEDRDPTHYSDFERALGTTNYQHRASYRVEILASNIKTGVRLYESPPVKEYMDNIVALSTILQDVPRSESVEDSVHLHYRTSSY